MKKQYASLVRIEYDHPITGATDAQFLHRLQSGLLLALMERGRLGEMQYRSAQERLNRQQREGERP